MITLDDCIALCGLTEDGVLAIAEHERLPAVAAAALGSFLVQQPHGTELLRNIIVDDVRRAQPSGTSGGCSTCCITSWPAIPRRGRKRRAGAGHSENGAEC
jgi:hypothetical protein